MKCEKCGKIERLRAMKTDKWARVLVCGMNGETLYELPMCAECAEKMIASIYGRDEADV